MEACVIIKEASPLWWDIVSAYLGTGLAIVSATLYAVLTMKDV